MFVIFGGTGDLAKRKLIPALYSLFKEGELSPDFAIVSISKDAKSEAEYHDEMKASLRLFTSYEINDEVWNSFCKKLFYKIIDFSVDDGGYRNLQTFLSELDSRFNTAGNRIFYLAVAPEFFGLIINDLQLNGMIKNKSSWQRVMVEKPFGTSLKMAKALNKGILKVLNEEKLFRIDHYLGKEMVQNIIAIRFCNSIFESMWNHHYIDNIQITSTELIGIENRGAYYENAGVLKDMLQNHILQMLSLVCMEPPVNLDPESIRDEKVKVLKSLRLFNEETAGTDIVVGQYGRGTVNEREVVGYKEEEKVSSESTTSTFIALKAHVDNFRWGGVPIYIRAGKRLDKRVSEIAIHFKKLPGTFFYKEFANTIPDILVINIQPNEGIRFYINAKRPGSDFAIERVGMEYCQTCRYVGNYPEAYERLILEAIRNNPAFFTRWDELEYSWKYIESIEKALKNTEFEYPNYQAGSYGPERAETFMERDDRSWWR